MQESLRMQETMRHLLKADAEMVECSIVRSFKVNFVAMTFWRVIEGGVGGSQRQEEASIRGRKKRH